jgi:hypothetical protein
MTECSNRHKRNAERAQENERNAQAMVTRCTTNQAYRMQENERNAQAIATRCTDQAYRIEELKGMLHLWQQDVLIKHTE